MPMTRRDLLRYSGAAAIGGFVVTAFRSPAGAADCTPPPVDCEPVTTTTLPPTTLPPTTSTTTTTTLPPVTTLPPATTVPPPTTTIPPSGFVNWSSQGYSGDVTINRAVLLDVDADVTSLKINAAGRLMFDPAQNRELRSTGNVIVRGVLEMKPADFTKLHRLTFLNVDESRFVGGGLDPVVTDVGLWVMDAGKLDLVGAQRLGWARSTSAMSFGATSVTLDADPTGWKVGDELAIAPMRFDAFEYDYAKITAISGRTVTLSSACVFPHPLSPQLDAGGRRQGAEILNLTRNVRVVGQDGHKAHMFIRSTVAQTLSYVGFRYLGPQLVPGTYGRLVLGRYGVHFHHCMNGSVGSKVTGCVARDFGSHAYVPHMSDGITFTDCISHETVTSAYWWDAFETSNDIAYLHCAASRVDAHNEEGHGLSGFKHGSGVNVVTHDCVAVSVYGPDGAGYFWDASETGRWDWKRNTAHTCNDYGIRTWQNNGQNHLVEDLTVFNCWGEGIKHGAYGNSYRYVGGAVVNNRGLGDKSAQITSAAISSSDDPNRHQQFKNLYIDGNGITDTLIELPDGAQVPATNSIQVVACTLRGARRRSLRIYPHGDPHYPSIPIDVQSCTFDSQTKTAVDSGCLPGAGFNVT